MIMSINLLKRDESNSNDLTIFLTVTTTHTISGSELELVPSTTTISTRMTKMTKITSSIRTKSADSTSTAESFYENKSSSSYKSSTTNASSSSIISTSTINDPTETTSINKSIDGLVGSNSSMKLGLAIGIPTSVIGVIIIIILAFIFIKKKNKKNPTKMISFNNEFFKVKDKNVSKFDTSSTLNSDSVKEIKTLQDSFIIENSGPMKNVNRQSIKTYLKDRFSKVINVKDLESEFYSPTVKSPVLKKFNLEKPKSDISYAEPFSTRVNSKKTNSFISKIEPQFLPIFFKDLKGKSNFERHKDLPRLPENDIPISLSEKAELPITGNSTIKIGTFHTVLKSYRKRREDELDVDIGDEAYVLQVHSDGWCKIKIISNEQRIGYIPKLCFE